MFLFYGHITYTIPKYIKDITTLPLNSVSFAFDVLN